MATENVGVIEYDSRISTKQLKRDSQEVEKVASNTAKSVGKTLDNQEEHTVSVLSSTASKIKTATVTAITAVTAVATAAGVATAVFGVKSAAEFQQTRIGLENMLGSADKARSLLSDISQFAAETPFEFPELAQATRQLVAFGFTGENAFKTMKRLGDVSAAVGAPINDLAYLMGTLKTQGRAFTIDIRQFAQRGIPIYEYLAKVLKTNEQEITKMIEAGKIGFPEVEKAFQAMTAEGGKFHGTMEKQSKSLSGIWSTLKDNIGQTVRELVGIDKFGDVKEGSLFDFLLKGGGEAIKQLPIIIKDIGDAISSFMPTLRQWYTNFRDVAVQIGEYLAPKLEALWNTISTKLIPVLADLWRNYLEPLIPVLGTGLVVALGLVLDGVNFLLTGFSAFIDWINNNQAIVIGLATTFGILATAMAFNSVFNALTVGFATLRLITIPSVMASVTALQATIAMPVVMGAIGIGLAMAALAQVKSAWDELRRIRDEIAQTENTLADSRTAYGKSLKARFERGEITAAERARLWKESALPGNAMGTNNWRGGPTWVGERGPEILDLPRGSKVIPNHKVDDYAGGGSGGITNISINLDGIMTRSKADEREIARSLIQSLNDELRAKNMQPIGGGAI